MPRHARVAIVTAGATGDGAKVARALASAGYAVVVVYDGAREPAEATVDAILADNGAALTVHADVGDALDVERMLDETAAAFGGLDLVVRPQGDATVLDTRAERRLRPGGAIVTRPERPGGRPGSPRGRPPRARASVGTMAEVDVPRER